MFKAKVAAGLMVSLAFLTPGVAQADPLTDEQLYLKVLHEEGIFSGKGDDGLLAAGYVVCERLRDGQPVMSVIKDVFNANKGLDSGGAGYLVGAAQSAFCEETIENNLT